jgi:hypothetical protein
VRTSEQINELATACAKAQAALRPAVKDATNPAFRSKYADLAAVMEAAKVYAAHGIAVFQDVTSETDAGIGVTTRLVHSSGQWLEVGPLVVPLGKRDAHGVGSATTYAKRYALSGALLIAADEDDDGNAAAEKAPTPKAAAPVQPDGFAEWLVDFEGTADNGLAALADGWKHAKPEYRAYLDATQPQKRAALKAKAQKVAA